MDQVSRIQVHKRNMRYMRYGIENRGIACTDRAIAADTYTPWRRFVYHTEIVLHAIWACSRLRDKVCGSRFGSLDLHEAFCANSLVTASGMINIGRVILRPNFVSHIHMAVIMITHKETNWTLDCTSIDGSFWASYPILCYVRASAMHWL